MKLRLWYKSLLAVAAIFLFFTHLDIYLFQIGLSPPPVLMIEAFVVLSFPLLFSFLSSQFRYFPRQLILWCLFYITSSVISYLFLTEISEESLQELRTRILTCVYLITLYVIFSESLIVQKITRLAILSVLIVNVINVFIELQNPQMFGGLNDTGRPAGFYINPNINGGALVLGMIFTVTLLPKIIRLPFVLFIGIGAFLTFSRGATICWILVVLLLHINRLITGNQLFYFAGLLGFLQLLGGGVLVISILEQMNLLNDNIRGRIVWLENPSSNDADSDTSRLEIVQLGWRLFLRHPVFGNGIASTRTWEQPIATHNMYLNLMVDHGFIGALIMPLLVYAVTSYARGEAKTLGLIFAVFTLLWGIFSHNILEERFMLTIFSLTAAMTVQSRLPKISSGEIKL